MKKAKRRRSTTQLGGFRRGDFVWLKSPEHVYLPGKVLTDLDLNNEATVKVLYTDEEIKISREDRRVLRLVNKEALKPVEDMILLPTLDEATILHNLRERFAKDLIYTRIGDVLISINPFKVIPEFSPEVIEEYIQLGDSNTQPHIFATADRAYRALIQNKENQSCIISGESGSGKTESTKLILQYIIDRSSGGSSHKKEKRKLQSRILESNPLLEAFGNAKTQQNNNSSRFGKLVKVCFDGEGCVAGGQITPYLLEKSRIVKQAESERNYHIFYQLCAAAANEHQINLVAKLRDPEDYYFLNQSIKETSTVIEGTNDLQGWRNTLEAMRILGIDSNQQNSIFLVLAAILHLGNVSFEIDLEASNQDSAKIEDRDELYFAAGQLGVKPELLDEILLKQNIGLKSSIERVYKYLTVEQAQSTRDTICQLLYSLVFQWLMEFINSSLQTTGKNNVKIHLNILDIFGFEVFEINGFEQLCINYCNEKLQRSFNDHILDAEIALLENEGIDAPLINYYDNSVVLDALENGQHGIFALLDEECKLPQGSDTNFLKQVLSQNVDCIRRPDIHMMRVSEVAQMSFTVIHYAGKVDYYVGGFLIKNRENSIRAFNRLMQTSTNALIRGLFEKATNSGREQRKSTVGSRFKQQLASLMQTLDSTSAHYIRCIKPNSLKKRNTFSSHIVLKQMQYSGLLEICRIRKEGFPSKMSFGEFTQRYKLLLRDGFSISNPAHMVKALVKLGYVREEGLCIGKSKVFLKLEESNRLEARRDQIIGKYFIKLQALIRGHQQRKRFAHWRGLLKKLIVAIQEGNKDKLQVCIKEVPVLPYGGEFVEVVKEARLRLQELQEQENALANLERAIKSEKRSEIVSAMYTVESLNVSESKSLHIARELTNSLEVDEEDIVTNLKSKMKFAKAISRSIDGITLEQIDSLQTAISEVSALEGHYAEVLIQAKTLVRQLQRQYEVQKLVEKALKTREDMHKALMAAKNINLNTKGAKELEARINFANRISDNPRRITLQSITATDKVGARLSHTVNLSKRMSKIQINSKSFENLALSKFYKIRSDEDFFARVLKNKQTKVRRKLEAQHRVIPKSLTILSEKLNRQALRLNKALLQYCGDMPFVDLQRPNLAHYILKTGLELPVLCDEIYLQLCKHLNHNSRSTSETRAWILMCLCTQLFPPSADFSPYLRRFLLSKQSTPLFVGNFARLSLGQVDRTQELGPSKVLPDVETVATYSQRPPVLASVKSIPKGGVILQIPVYPDADVDHVIRRASKYSNIDRDDVYMYGLFLHKGLPKDAVQLKQRLVNFYKKWDRNKLQDVDYFAAVWLGRENELFQILMKKYGPEPKFQKSGSEKGEVTGSSNYPYPIPWWKHLGDVFLETMRKGAEPQLTLRRRLIGKNEVPTLELLEHLHQNIKLGELEIEDKDDILELSSMFVRFRRKELPAARDMSILLRTFLPEFWLKKMKTEKITDLVMKKAQSLSNDKSTLKENFLQICERYVTYGMCFFPVKQSEQAKKRVVCAVDSTGVHLFNETRKKILFTYSFVQIREFGATTERFWMNVHKGGPSSPVIEVAINTELAWPLYSLIYDYMKYSKRGDLKRTRRKFNRSTKLRAVLAQIDTWV